MDQPEFFWDPCTTLLYKHKYKDLNNCLQSPEMFLYWIYTMNTSYLLFRWVCEGWQTSRSFFGIHAQLFYINTNIRVRTTACNHLRCPFMGTTLQVHLILFRKVCEGWWTSQSFLDIHAQLWLDTFIKKRMYKKVMGQTWDKMNGS